MITSVEYKMPKELTEICHSFGIKIGVMKFIKDKG